MKYKQTLNEEGIRVSKRFSTGTIVIAIVGATIGSTAILQREVYAPDSVIGISPYKYHNVFLETLLQFWQPQLLAIAPESARANINLSILNDIPIVEACLDKQEQFATFVAQTDKSKVVRQTS
jgi:type I restriction enzyme S subunit